MKLKTTKQLEAHNPIVHGGLNSLDDPKIIDFSSNVTPLGAPKSVIAALKRKMHKIASYPDSDSNKLEQSIQKYTKIPPSNIIIGNGATELIYNFCSAFLSQNTPVLMASPTFGEYQSASTLNGCNVYHFKTMNLAKDISNFVKKIPKNGCVFVCNPNNPTGELLSKDLIKKIILNSKKKSTFVFLDECFIEMTPGKNESVISLIKKFDNLFVLRSLTKSFGLAGLRIGYGIGSKQMISILKKIKVPWNVNILAQEGAISALNNLSHLQKSKSIIKKESIYLKKKISEIDGFECYNSSTNFLLIHTRLDSTSLQKKLLRKKILIRDCKNFDGLDNHYIRVAVKTRKENNILLKELRNL